VSEMASLGRREANGPESDSPGARTVELQLMRYGSMSDDP
jgi:hypothetical protein